MYVSLIGKCCQSKLKEKNSLVKTMWTKFDPEASSSSLCVWTMKAGTKACFSLEMKLHAPDLIVPRAPIRRAWLSCTTSHLSLSQEQRITSSETLPTPET